MDKLTTRLRTFTAERQWERFHTPRNLATAISVEAAELLELFQWHLGGTDENVDQSRLVDELADVVIYALLLGDRCGIDLEEAVKAKIERNAHRYPVETSAGNATKYTDL